MGLGILPLMGIGAGLGLLTHGPKGILPGAALGGIGGGIGNAFGAGSVGTALGEGAKVAATESAPFTGAVFNESTGTWLNPEFYAGTSTPLATYTGGQGLLSNATGNLIGSIPDYVTPKNVLGAANILSSLQPQQAPLQSPSGGMVRPGSIGTVNYGMASSIPVRKRVV